MDRSFSRNYNGDDENQFHASYPYSEEDYYRIFHGNYIALKDKRRLQFFLVQYPEWIIHGEYKRLYRISCSRQLHTRSMWTVTGNTLIGSQQLKQHAVVAKPTDGLKALIDGSDIDRQLALGFMRTHCINKKTKKVKRHE